MTSAKSSSTDASPEPWWRVAMVWVVIAGPLAVVLASVASAAIAWRALDPVLAPDEAEVVRAAAGVDPKSAQAPALKGRNHAASPSP